MEVPYVRLTFGIFPVFEVAELHIWFIFPLSVSLLFINTDAECCVIANAQQHGNGTCCNVKQEIEPFADWLHGQIDPRLLLNLNPQVALALFI